MSQSIATEQAHGEVVLRDCSPSGPVLLRISAYHFLTIKILPREKTNVGLSNSHNG